MRMLLALALTFGAVVGAEAALATVYVPGQYRDGVYIRPHFLDSPDQTYQHQLVVPAGEPAKDLKPAPVPAGSGAAAPGKKLARPTSS